MAGSSVAGVRMRSLNLILTASLLLGGGAVIGCSVTSS